MNYKPRVNTSANYNLSKQYNSGRGMDPDAEALVAEFLEMERRKKVAKACTKEPEQLGLFEGK